MNTKNLPLSSGVRRRISSAHGRRFFLRLINLLMALLALGLILASFAMLIDWVIAFRSTTWRLIMSFSVGAVFILAGVWIWKRLTFNKGLRSTANWLDEVNPALEERLSTVVELKGKSSHSPEMLGVVGSQVARIGIGGGTRQLIFAKPFLAAIIAGVFAISLLGVVKLVSGPGFSHLIGRLFLPFSEQTITGLPDEATSEVHIRGRVFEVRVPVAGKVPSEAIIEYRTADGSPEQHRVEINSDSSFVESSMGGLEKDFAYRVIAGDDQTPWNEVRVVDRPQFDNLKLVITPPSYTRAEEQEWSAMPRKIEVPEGSNLSLSFSVDQELFGTSVTKRVNEQEEKTELQSDESRAYHFDTNLRESSELEVVLISMVEEMQSKIPMTIAVKRDHKPSVGLLEGTETFAMKAEEVLDIKFTASDDYGIVSAEIVAEISQSDGRIEEYRFPVDLDSQSDPKDMEVEASLDLKKLPLRRGSELTFSVEVKDERGLQGRNSADLQEMVDLAESDLQKLEDALQAARDLEKQLQAAKESNDQALTAMSGQVGNSPANGLSKEQSQETRDLLEEAARLASAAAQGQDSPQDNASKHIEQAKAAVAAAQEGRSAKESLATAREEIDQAIAAAGELAKAVKENLSKLQVEKRKLDLRKDDQDAAKSDSAQVTIDELAEHHIAGDGAKKQQIAIQEVLDLIHECAETGRKVIAKIGSPSGSGNYKALLAASSPELIAALEKGTKGAEELRRRSEGTPYSFFGIQAKAMVEAGFAPALEAVGKASQLVDSGKIFEKLQLADERLRWVIGLLKENKEQLEKMIEYEEVLELAHEFKKMHQITIEDMPPSACDCRSGPYPKLKQEFGDQAIQGLIANLKLKREALKRLSELLQKNPELRARYLAQSKASGGIYREELSRLRNQQLVLADGLSLLVPDAIAKREKGAPKPWNGMLRSRLLKFAGQTTEALGIARIWIPTETPPGQRTELENSLAMLSQAVENLSKSDPLKEEEFVGAVDAVGKSRRDMMGILERPWWKGKQEEYTRFRLEDLQGMSDELEACATLAQSLRGKKAYQFLGQLQDELNTETLAVTLGMMDSLSQISGVSPKADETIEELDRLLNYDLYPRQKRAMGFLDEKVGTRAFIAMNAASTSLEKATHLLDSAIVEFVRAKSEQEALVQKSQPEPQGEARVLPDPSEEAIEEAIARMLRALEEESRKPSVNKLGITTEKNFQINTDWEKPSKGEKSERSELEQQKEQQLEAARQAAIAAGKAQQLANQRAQKLAQEMTGKPVVSWQERQVSAFEGRNDWNTIPSQLKKSLTQDFDTAVPEEFRKAIDEYFRMISKINEQ